MLGLVCTMVWLISHNAKNDRSKLWYKSIAKFTASWGRSLKNILKKAEIIVAISQSLVQHRFW